MIKLLEKSFFCRDTETVAKELLGKVIIIKNNIEYKRAVIVETEAYFGEDDPASHARFGKTKRNALMFGESGLVYVYLIYGMYNCINITTEREGTAGAVLIRGVEPIDRIAGEYNKTNGPGKLCKTYNITRDDNGLDVCDADSRINIGIWENIDKNSIRTSFRIGVSSDLERHLRFFILNNKFVSKGS